MEYEEDFEKEIKNVIKNIKTKKTIYKKSFKQPIYEVFDMSKYDFKTINIEKQLSQIEEPKRVKIIQCHLYNTFEKTMLTEETEKSITELKEYLPNFNSVIDYILSQLKLNTLNKNKMFFKPILIMGEPGIGKTYLANEIAKILDIKSEFIDYGSLQDNFQIKGSPTTFKDSKQGLIADMYLETHKLNNILILDEIDKNEGRNVESILYQLTEEINAKQFKDEFLELKMDLTGLIIIATANDITKLNDAILSRFQVFNVEKLNEENTKTLSKKIYLDIISEYDFFNKELEENILNKLSKLTPRDIKSKLILMVNKSIEKYSITQLKKSKNIIVNYFDNDIKKKSIGF